MAGETTEQTRRATDTDWVAKAKAIGEIVSKVGIPTIFTLAMIGLGVGITMGKIDNPFVSARQFEDHQKSFFERQQWLEDAHKQQTDKLSSMVDLLSEIRCDGKFSDKERLACYKAMKGTTP